MKHKTRTERVYNEATGWYETREVELKGYTFTDEDRILIVREYLESGVSAEKIIKKYHISSRSVLFSWMDKLLNEKDLLPLPQESILDKDMAKTKDECLKEKDAEIKRLRKALELAYENNPDMESMQLRRLSSESSLDRAKAQTGLRASVLLRLGLAQTGNEFNESIHNLNDEQSISVTVSIPILDWGQGRGRVRVAKNNLDLTNMQLEQQQLSFDRQVTRAVNQFNLQQNRVDIAYRTMTTAQHRYEVARQLYMTGRSTVLDLNSAITSKDTAYRGYVSALSTWWQLYYTIRSMTGYDFQNDLPLEYQVEYGY